MSTASPAEGAPLAVVVRDRWLRRSSTCAALRTIPGLEIVDARAAAQALDIVAGRSVALVVTELDLLDGSGLEIVLQLDGRVPRPRYLLLSGGTPVAATHAAGVEIVAESTTETELLRIARELLAGPAAATPLRISDLLRLAANGRRAVRLEVEREGATLGSIVVGAGAVHAARDATGSGREALLRLARAQGSRVRIADAADASASPPVADASLADVLGAPISRPMRAVARPVVAVPSPSRPSVAKAPRNVQPPPLTLVASSAAGPATAPATENDRPTAPSALALEVLFRERVERGIEAVLLKRHADAFSAFAEAAEIHPDDPIVKANLARLRTLGHGA